MTHIDYHRPDCWVCHVEPVPVTEEHAEYLAAAKGGQQALRPDGRTPCCDQDHGGSHYHCARCGDVTGMYGHHRGGETRDGKFRAIEGHFCCPGDCEKPEAHR